MKTAETAAVTVRSKSWALTAGRASGGGGDGREEAEDAQHV